MQGLLSCAAIEWNIFGENQVEKVYFMSDDTHAPEKTHLYISLIFLCRSMYMPSIYVQCSRIFDYYEMYQLG